MALNGRKMWGRWALACKRCSSPFQSGSAHRRYCSKECREVSLARRRRVLTRAYYYRRMEAERLGEKLEAIALMTTHGRGFRPKSLGLAGRMMAYA